MRGILSVHATEAEASSYTPAIKLLAVSLVSAALLAPAAALAKAGVVARLENPSVLSAPAGVRVSLVWTLRAGARPFTAEGVYVRLRGRGGTTSTGAAVEVGAGRFRARVVIPRGGVRAVAIRLTGWASGPHGTRRADVSFPIANDPTR